MKLIRNARAIAGKFYTERAGEKVSDAPGPTEEKNTELARFAAQRQGRLALVVLGQRWFDEPALKAGRPSENYGDVENRVRRLHTDERWWTALARASEEIGGRRPGNAHEA